MSRILITGYEGQIPRVYLTEEDCAHISLTDTSIERVDLSELYRMRKLQTLDLSNNMLKEIDLKQLERSYELTSLNLAHNNLSDVDLRPLTRCRKLSILSLASNHLHSIDLKPLRNCDELEYLYISGNQFEKIDLCPLSDCTNLREIAISSKGDPGFGDIEHALDIQPLIKLRRLKKVQISQDHYVTLGLTQMAMKEKPSGVTEALKKCNNVTIEKMVRYRKKKLGVADALASFEIEIARLPSSYWYSVRHQILRSFNLDAVAAYDGNLTPLVRTAEREGKDWLNLTISKVADEISRGSSTILFDLDEIPMDLPSHGKLRAAILDARTNEIREATIFVCERCVDFREVLYTAWGFRMLKEEGQWIFGISGKHLIDMRDRLRQLGFGLVFKSIKLRDSWPTPRNEPSLKIRQTILGYIDRTAQSLFKDRAMQCILKSSLHPLKPEIERIMTEIYGGEEK